MQSSSLKVVALLTLAGLAVGAFFAAQPRALAQQQTLRWDIVHLFFTDPVQVTEGGEASAKANDGSRITLTGKGTFVPGDPRAVTGGGTWTTQDPQGATTGSGTYTVTELLYWQDAPGRQGPPVVNRVVRGNYADTRAGLAVFRVKYSNGSNGTLVVSCRLGGSPASIFEGVTASMGFVTYWNKEPDAPGIDANRTLFSISR